jgi:hypothetical protein
MRRALTGARFWLHCPREIVNRLALIVRKSGARAGRDSTGDKNHNDYDNTDGDGTKRA